MSGNASHNNDQQAPAEIPQTTPRNIGYGHPEFHFVQSVMELHKTMAETKAMVEANNAVISNVKDDIKGIKAKLDDLVTWKNMILGGAAAIAFLLSLAFGLTKLLEGATISFSEQKNQITSPMQNQGKIQSSKPSIP